MTNSEPSAHHEDHEPDPVDEAVRSFQNTALFNLEDAIEAGRIASVDDCWAVLRDTTVDLSHWLDRIPDEVKEKTIRPFTKQAEFAEYIRLPLRQRFDFVIRHLGRATAVADLCRILEYMEGAELTIADMLPASPYSQHEPVQMTEYDGAWIFCYRDLPKEPKNVDLHLLLIRSHRFYFQRVFDSEFGEEVLHPYLSAEEFRGAAEQHLRQFSPETQDRIRTWLKIGSENYWTRRAYDPPFTPLSFQVCTDVEELADLILQGNWCLGRAFVLGDICFINQVNGGDEWLTIKGSTAFESITMRGYNESVESAKERLLETIGQIRNASETQCKRREYEYPYELCPPGTYELTPETKTEMTASGRTSPAFIKLSFTVQLRHNLGETTKSHTVRIEPQDLVAVIKHSIDRFVLSRNKSGDLRLDCFRNDYEAVQTACIAANAVPAVLGEDYAELTPMELFQRLLPHLRPVHEQS